MGSGSINSAFTGQLNIKTSGINNAKNMRSPKVYFGILMYYIAMDFLCM